MGAEGAKMRVRILISQASGQSKAVWWTISLSYVVDFYRSIIFVLRFFIYLILILKMREKGDVLLCWKL